MTAFERLLAALETAGSRSTGNGRQRMARCPAHNDGHASLSITQGNDRVLVKCQAGCDTDEVLAVLQLNRADLFDTPRQNGAGHQIVATYDYTDEHETLLFQVVRFEPKDFRQRKPDGTGGWEWKLGDTPRVLYRLPHVLAAAKAGQTVFVVEGEKDVHSIEKAGSVATTNPGGAGKWQPQHTTALHGANVIIVADRDAPGRAHARDVASHLRHANITTYILEPAAGKDVTEHLSAGLGLEDLAPVADEPTDDPPADLASWLPVDLSNYLDGTYTPVIPTLLTRTDGVCLLYPGLVHSLHGESESGKSMVAQHLAAEQVMDSSPVLFIDFESDAATVTERLLMFGATAKQVLTHFTYIRPEVAPESLAEKAAFLQMLSRTYVLAVIDGVTDSLGMFKYKSNDQDEVATWMRRFPKTIAKYTKAAVAVIDHVTKDSPSRGRFAIGAQHKLAGLSGAGYTVEVVDPLGRGLRGVIVLRVGKDRPGYVRGVSGPMRKGDRTQETARVVVDSRKDPDHPDVTIEPWQNTKADPQSFRLTGYMEKISRVLEQADAPTTFRGIGALVPGRGEYIASAAETLVLEGYVARQRSGSANMHRSLKPYREDSDPLSDKFEASVSQRLPVSPGTQGVSVSPSRVSTRETGDTPLGPSPASSVSRVEQQWEPTNLGQRRKKAT